MLSYSPQASNCGLFFVWIFVKMLQFIPCSRRGITVSLPCSDRILGQHFLKIKRFFRKNIQKLQNGMNARLTSCGVCVSMGLITNQSTSFRTL
jgi:pyrimidine deaminase RibD-like protein